MNSGSAIAPKALRQSRTSPRRPWRRASLASLPAEAIGHVRSERRSERARHAAPAGNHAAKRAAHARDACPGRASRTRQRDAASPARGRADNRRLRGGDARSPREQFNATLQAFQAGQYPEAETGFKTFLTANPAHRLTPDAIFYMGETCLQRSHPRGAVKRCLKVTTDYSKSPRAAESLVQLGQTLAALGNSEQACATLTEFGKRYPTASASVKKLAEHESAKDHC